MRLNITKREILSLSKMAIPTLFFVCLYIVIEEAIQSLPPVEQVMIIVFLGALTLFLYKRAVRRLLF